MSKSGYHKLECDVLVAGGGPAGVPCALAAARGGARVVLCQDRPVLGGNASSEVRMHIVGADGMRGEELATEARESGIMEELRLELCVQNPQRSPSMLDLVFYDRIRREPNITLLLNTSVVGCRMDGGRIHTARAIRPSTEDEFEIHAGYFVDCTGDGRLGVEAGAPFVHGREGSNDSGESLAEVEEGDGHTLGSTLLYQARQYDRPMPFVAPPWARKFSRDDLRLRLNLDPEEVDCGLEYGYWWAEWGGHLDTIKDNEKIRDELLAIVLGIWDHVKNSGEYPGVENWAMTWFGWLPGKRESRRFEGRYKLTQADVWEGRQLPDAIAYGGWPIDTHPYLGVDAVDEPPCRQTVAPYLFDIPLRACVSATIDNLLFAGRNISASHIAFASTRVMATCAAVGQGVGTALGYALKQRVAVAELADDGQRMSGVQQQLLRDDAFLIGVSNSDPADWARQAAIRASSSQPGGEAELVISGATRAVHGPKGARSDRVQSSSHRWMSDPAAGLPCWIELEWPAEVDVAEVRLVFDTGLHRRLTLSHSDAFANKMHWGRPQPETVRDFEVLGYGASGSEFVICRVTGNYQRLCVHSLAEPVSLRRLRVAVSATNGIDHGRICEIRVYGGDG